MKIVLIDAKSRGIAVNKTMAGGFGNAGSIAGGNDLFAFLLQSVKGAGQRIPLLEFAYLSAMLKARGHEVFFSEGGRIPAAGLYIVYGSLVEHSAELRAAARVRREYPAARTGFIGLFPSIRPELYADAADFVVKGEAEALCLENDAFPQARGIVEAGRVEELDSLPFPDHSLCGPGSHYPFFGRRRVYPVRASAGCGQGCGYYCPYPLHGAVRRRSVESVIREAARLRELDPRGALLFRDADFCADRDFVSGFCRGMSGPGGGLPWACEANPLFLDEDLIAVMADAGCRAITIGIDSHDPGIGEKTGRRRPGDDRLRALVRCCETRGIAVTAGYIIASYWDTRDTVLDTISFAVSLGSSFAHFMVSTPYPGTAYYDFLSARGLILPVPWTDFDSYTPVFTHPSLRRAEIEALKRRAYRDFYLRPSWAARFLRRRV